jgi:hypothetical protein
LGRVRHCAQRSQNSSGYEPTERDGDYGHDGKGDHGLDKELVQIGRLLGC